VVVVVVVVVVIEFSSVSYLLCWLKSKLSAYRTSTNTQCKNKQPTEEKIKIMVFVSVHSLLKFKNIPTNARYYSIKFLQ